MKLSTVVLEGCFYVGASLCRLCKSNIFAVRAVFITDGCHIFPQSVLAVIPLIEGMTGVVVSSSCPACWAGPPLCSVDVTTLLRVGSAPQLFQ